MSSPIKTKAVDIENLEVDSLKRIQKLRNELVNTMPEICADRARYVTEAYKANEADPPVLRRAKAFALILENMSIYIGDDELVVGNHSFKPRAAPIFPECYVDFIENEIDDFALRKADQYYVNPEVKRELLEEIIPYWKGRTLYDRAVAIMPGWVWDAQKIGAISARGNYTSGDGHLIVDYQKLLEKGLLGIRAEAEEALNTLDPYNAIELRKKPFLEGVLITLDAAILFAERYALEAEHQALTIEDPMRRKELHRIAEACRNIPANPPQSWYEAVQSAWFIHLLTQIESNGHSFSMGRLDQYTYPFYKNDLSENRLSEHQAIEILECLWLKMFSINKLRPWSTTRYSIGYPTYQNVTIGGQLPDGGDATNELSYAILRTIQETRLTQPNVSARFHVGTSDRFLMECARTIRLGFGMPAMFDDEIIIPALLEKGVAPVDAFNYAMDGCVETTVPGKWGYRNTGMSFLNYTKVLELTYNNGRDPNTGTCLHPGKGDLATFKDFDELYDAFNDQLDFYIKASAAIDTVADLALEAMVPDAFCSALVNDCISRGLTVKEGGAVYDIISGLQSGIANVANSLIALKKMVYEDKVVSPQEVMDALKSNFEDEKGKRVQQILLSAPKYGNDIDEVDLLARQVFMDYHDEIAKYHNTRYGRGPIGGGYCGSTSNVAANVPLGQMLCATPDGRKSTNPIAEGVSPSHGTDTRGPTAVMASVCKLPTIKSIGQLLNLRLSPDSLKDEEGARRLVLLLRGFQALKGWHVQFNTVSTETLRDAQEHPEEYRDLIVRVAGYSALFITLDKATQDDIIDRTVYD